MKLAHSAVAVLLATALSPTAAHAIPGAVISGSFGDSCRDFAAQSSKDISHVVLSYADGRTVKDEGVGSRDFATDGGVGDELATVTVKAGTTSQSFVCQSSRPPVAVLEVRLEPTACVHHVESSGYAYLWCPAGAPNEYRREFVDTGGLDVWFNCDLTGGGEGCRTFSVRGTSSTDPDDDITGWSIDFCGEAVVTGAWVTSPPVEVTHLNSGFCEVTLTVTDATGNTDTARVGVGIVDGTPD